MSDAALVKKIAVTKQNQDALKVSLAQYQDSGFEGLNTIKPGDNLYIVRLEDWRDRTVVMNRQDVLNYLATSKIVGLKLDVAGRLIEDRTRLKVYEEIVELIIKGAESDTFANDLDNDPNNFSQAQELAARLVDDPKDPWAVHGMVNTIIGDLAQEHHLFMGSVFISDEYNSTTVSKHYNRAISSLASIASDIVCQQKYDKDTVLAGLKSANEVLNEFFLRCARCIDYATNETYRAMATEFIKSKEHIAEPFIEFGDFEHHSIIDSAVALQALDKRTQDYYGDSGVWLHPALREVVDRIVDRLKERDPLEFELRILKKNIEAFRKAGFQASEKSSKDIIKGWYKKVCENPVDSLCYRTGIYYNPTIEEYIDLTLALQKLYYQNPENLKYEAEGIIAIPKLKLRIIRKPYILVVSSTNTKL